MQPVATMLWIEDNRRTVRYAEIPAPIRHVRQSVSTSVARRSVRTRDVALRASSDAAIVRETGSRRNADGPGLIASAAPGTGKRDRKWLHQKHKRANGSIQTRAVARERFAGRLANQLVDSSLDCRRRMDGCRRDLRLAEPWNEQVGHGIAHLSFAMVEWGLLTPAIMVVDRRLPFSGKELGRRVAVHLALSLVFTEVYFYLFTAMRAAFGVTPWSSLRLSNLTVPRCSDGRSGAGSSTGSSLVLCKHTGTTSAT